ncbi:hypothetical protein ANTQUA_LOCUS5085 [Anthophora quadrimaculata]
MAEETLKTLLRQRASTKAQVTRLFHGLEENVDTLNLPELEIRQRKLEEYYQKYFTIQDQIEGSETAQDLDPVADFEKLYFKCADLIGTSLARLRNRPSIQAQTTSNASTPITNAANILPKIHIKQFDGNFIEWQGFYDTFRTLVHDNDSIPIIHKFHLLKSYLIGNAANVTDSLSASEDNYFVAWELVKKRFDQPRKIIQGHIRALFELPEVVKDKPSSLRVLAEGAEMHINALNSLNQPTNWDEMIIYIISSKLDKQTRTSWERTIEDGVMPKYKELLSFLNKYARDDEPVKLITHTKDNFTRRYTDRNFKSVNRVNTYVSTKPAVSCPVCKQPHYINQCQEFLKQSPRDRYKTVKSLNHCINCLHSNHSFTQCRASTCRKCGKKHHTLLHLENHSFKNINENSNTTDPTSSQAVALIASSEFKNEVLLSTARLLILDKNNRIHECRVLLDPGSQRNFITERFAAYLRLPKDPLNIRASGIGRQENRIKYAVEAQINSANSKFKCKATFLTLPEITSPLPSRTFDKGILRIPENLVLADPLFNKSSNIDLLLGEYLYYKIVGTNRIRSNNDKVVLQDSELGWILSGEIDSVQTNTSCLNVQTLDEQLEKFWELDQYPNAKIMSPQDQRCEEFFKQTTHRNENGRYVVRLPFNDKKHQLGNSYKSALNRFYSLERRLQANEHLRSQYIEFLNEYETLGHMVEIENSDCTDVGYYLPHHAVVKTDSLTTKVRVVFDASAKSDTGISLNDVLMIGPTIQEDVFSLIARFRKHTYVLTADIEKMFRQILVHPDDAVYQKILWRKNPKDRLKTYLLNTITYGTAPAPFLSIRCLQQLADDEASNYPLAARAIKTDFYMDDLLTGTSSLAEALRLRDQLIQILKRGGMTLRQWASNEPSLLTGFQADLSDQYLSLDPHAIKKTLGVYWHPREDKLRYKVAVDSETQNTKRQILSKIAQLFDPLGLVGPVLVKAKILMQQLWKCKTSWDDKVPTELLEIWNNYKVQLPDLINFEIPRQLLIENPIEIQLHGFCDASQIAYGACIYLRSIDSNNQVKINLVAAKSRVAPLKFLTIPRLELCAALLLANLYEIVSNALKITFHSVYFWSDSTIALHWLKSTPHSLKTFVANRVAKIQDLTDQGDWKHIVSADNPADCLSRGQYAKEFLSNQLWLNGPTWLSDKPSNWPIAPIPNIDIPEQRPVVNLCTRVDSTDFLQRLSSWAKIERVIAYCIRFLKNASHQESNKGPLSTRELRRSHDCLIRLIQRRHFASELHNLLRGIQVSKESKILNLSPFVDKEGIIRVGGRLKNSDITYGQKFPILLPRSDPITHLIIECEHQRQLHTGILGTLNAIRQRYWPIDGKNLTRHIIRKCIRCFKINPCSTVDYPMGNLPKDRVVATRPFQITGIDYCGPFSIKEKKYRNTKRIKVYVAVFICFVTKAVHLELVSELSTEAFIATLKRFFSRRGYANTLYSDNATNFVGAKNKLQEVQAFLESEQQQRGITEYLSTKGISWHFSPPRSPHFGGLWEAAVRTFKHHLYRTVGDALLTYELFNTYIIEIEAILNSRPLTPLSPDPNDLSALTPAHFLIGESLRTMPERDVSDITNNRLTVWEHIQKMKQHFWRRWYKEYLNELSIRSKWRKGSTVHLQPGTLVLLKEENLPPMRWSIGRIVETHPGEDEVIRVVTIKTASGVYRRSVKNICPLPIDKNVEQPTTI